jgi:RNA polymerase primary sigma factor
VILNRRFGLDGSEPQTLKIIGRDFGITRERVRQIEARSHAKLRIIIKGPERGAAGWRQKNSAV